MLHPEIAAKDYPGHCQRVKTATAPSRRSLHATEAPQRLFEHCPELNRTHNLVRQFAAMLDTSDATPFNSVLHAV
ncbi:hypothetical protein [Streptomyces spongiae]|uniref:hypothetical protein n=1 Tax=Streptomyces spongiae TaxID=565072 RepID=UPI0018847CAA|nr:hypothetical protein [Streptomyces spongiae]